VKTSLFLLIAFAAAAPLLRAQDEEEKWPEAFTKHLKGTIGDKLQIEMELQGEPGTELFFNGQRQFRGHYWYANKRIPIDLYGSETAYQIAKMDEQVLGVGDKGWENTGTFEGALKEDGSYVGTWTDKDGKRKLPFKHSPFQPAGAVKLKAYGLESSWTERTAEGASSLDHTAFLVQVAEDTPAAKKINAALLQHAQDYFTEEESEDANKKDSAETKPKDTKAKKPATLDSVHKSLLAKRDEELITNHEKWSSGYAVGVELNEHGILCTGHLQSEYTGGAHPNSNTVYYTFDTKTGEEMELKKLFKPEFLEALPKLATEKLREQKGFPLKEEPGPRIESLDFEKGDGAWFLSAAGFVVHFDPYAIDSYARGNVDLTIPWAELASWLAPDSPLKPFVTKTK
jgi:hypothetical protein